MSELKKAIENLSHAVSACNKLDAWRPGEREPYLLEAAREVVACAETPPKGFDVDELYQKFKTQLLASPLDPNTITGPRELDVYLDGVSDAMYYVRAHVSSETLPSSSANEMGGETLAWQARLAELRRLDLPAVYGNDVYSANELEFRLGYQAGLKQARPVTLITEPVSEKPAKEEEIWEDVDNPEYWSGTASASEGKLVDYTEVCNTLTGWSEQQFIDCICQHKQRISELILDAEQSENAYVKKMNYCIDLEKEVDRLVRNNIELQDQYKERIRELEAEVARLKNLDSKSRPTSSDD